MGFKEMDAGGKAPHVRYPEGRPDSNDTWDGARAPFDQECDSTPTV